MQLPWANPEKGLQNTGQNTYVPPHQSFLTLSYWGGREPLSNSRYEFCSQPPQERPEQKLRREHPNCLD